MRVFYDTEFIESGHDSPIQLVSIGLVREDGAEYYAQSVEFDPEKASPWVRINVLDKLLDCPAHPNSSSGIDWAYHEAVGGRCGNHVACPWRSRRQLREEVREFIDETRPNIELWANFADYDHVSLAQLFGAMIDLPKDWPMYTLDIKQLSISLGNPRLPEQSEGEHNALFDARWNKQAYEFLAQKEQALYDAVAAVVQTNGVAHCYDRYTRDDDWTYCIFCEEGEFDPHEQPVWHWKHKLDCPLFVLRKVLDHRAEGV